MNVDLLLQAKAAILANPNYADMNTFYHCRTPACIAGHIASIAGWSALGMWTPLVQKEDKILHCELAARRELAAGDIEADGDKIRLLFYVGFWPKELRDAYESAADKGEELNDARVDDRLAKIMSMVIDRFIETYPELEDFNTPEEPQDEIGPDPYGE